MVDLVPPPLKAGQVRIDVSYCGICGSDIHFRNHLPLGTVMGHEVVGRVSEISEGVSGWDKGERVAVFPVEPCGACPRCHAGWSNICEQRQFGIGGSMAWGGYAQSLVALPSMLFRLPDSLDDRAAALIEPLTVSLHAVKRSSASPDAAALVMGAGTIGLMTVLALRAMGHDNIAVIEPNAARLAHISRLGVHALESGDADARVTAALGGPPATIFECAGYPGALVDAVRMVAPHGEIMVLSAPTNPVPLPQWQLMLKEARLNSAIFYSRDEFAEAIDLLASGRVPADALPVSVMPLTDAARALDELLVTNTPHMKVLLQADA
ncbi:zinc-dependent alcohol dehydrogenase [Rhizorhabdus wittichii]|uniref:zinc-dependent alcohol dehydrogenase n=1 Tax=Rhizorhabdus wittichii TaxID=160791 RepID=UPI00178C5DD1|nr:alcohol dehydrogenase catalytic domain-containing protein [Rhizorhabdus wittichii]